MSNNKFVSKVYSLIWNLSEITGIGLGRFAPHVFSMMIGRPQFWFLQPTGHPDKWKLIIDRTEVASIYIDRCGTCSRLVIRYRNCMRTIPGHLQDNFQRYIRQVVEIENIARLVITSSDRLRVVEKHIDKFKLFFSEDSAEILDWIENEFETDKAD